MKKLFAAVENFFLRPAYATPLAAVRIGLSLILLLQAFVLRHSLWEFYSSDGFLEGAIAEFIAVPYAPTIPLLIGALYPLGIPESTVLLLLAFVYIMSLCFLLVGWRTRVWAFVAWLLHWCFMATGSASGYGMDLYAHVFLFYLIFAPSGDLYSIDSLRGRGNRGPSWQARLALRVMQLQLAVTYLISARDKSMGVQWWNGELIWRSITVPPFRQFEMTWLADWPLFLKMGGWATLLLEGGYCIFIWPRKTRWLWILGMIGLHAGIAIFMGLQFFGLIMCTLTLAVFGASAEGLFMPLPFSPAKTRVANQSAAPAQTQ